MLTLRKIENVSTGPNNRPKLAVKIVGEYLCDLQTIHVYCYVRRRCVEHPVTSAFLHDDYEVTHELS